MYYISPDNEYPRHIGDIQIEHPSYQMGDPVPAGWQLVADVAPPAREAGQVLEEGFPVEIDGVLSRNWIVREPTAEEMAVRTAPQTAKAKLLELGLNEYEIEALTRGLVR
jgi:hypothetical protein